MRATETTKRIEWGRRTDLGDLFDDERLKGFEVAAVDSGIRGVKLRYFPKIDEKAIQEQEGIGSVNA